MLLKRFTAKQTFSFFLELPEYLVGTSPPRWPYHLLDRSSQPMQQIWMSIANVGKLPVPRLPGFPILDSPKSAKQPAHGFSQSQPAKAPTLDHSAMHHRYQSLSLWTVDRATADCLRRTLQNAAGDFLLHLGNLRGVDVQLVDFLMGG